MSEPRKRARIAAAGATAAVLLLALASLGCAAALGRLSEPPVVTRQPHPAPHDLCPYATVYVAVSANGLKADEKIAEQIRIAYSQFLAEQGFHVVAEPEEAYWSALSMVGLSHRADSSFAWTLYMLARHDLQGTIRTPFDFARDGHERDELSGYMLLREIRQVELEPQARRAAVDTADALLPHANRMCGVWSMNLEKLRRELVKEMTRVRQQRADGAGKGRVRVEPADSGRTYSPAGKGDER